MQTAYVVILEVSSDDPEFPSVLLGVSGRSRIGSISLIDELSADKGHVYLEIGELFRSLTRIPIEDY